MFQFLLISVMLFAFGLVYADGNPKINIQGRLTHDYGDPIKNTEISITLEDDKGMSIIKSTSTKTDSEGLYDVDVEIENNITISSQTTYKLTVNNVTKNLKFSHVPFSIYSSTATYAVNAGTATYAQKDYENQIIADTYIKGLAVSESTITITKGNNTSTEVYLPKASGSEFGLVKVGTGLSVNDGKISVSSGITVDTATYAQKDYENQIIADTYIKGLAVSESTITITKGNNTSTEVYLPKASGSEFGLVKVGTGLSVNDGKISVSSGITVDTATYAQKDYENQIIADTYIKGLAVSESTITITKGNNTSTEVYLPKASGSEFGLVKVGTGLSVNDGKISVSSGITVDTATYAQKDYENQIIADTYIKGLAVSESTITITKGNNTSTEVYLPKASGSEFGLVKVGTGLSVNDGKISVSSGITVDTATWALNLATINKLSDDNFCDKETHTYEIKVGNAVYAEKAGTASYVSTATISSSAGDRSDSMYVLVSSFGSTGEFVSQEWMKFSLDDNKKFTGADLAEMYASSENLQPGDVVSIDTTKNDAVVKTKVAEDTKVAGVVSTEPGLLLNKNQKGYKLALVGKVPTKVCNEGGNIKRGDLLVSASIAGYARKAGANPKPGTIIGKALANFSSKKGTILVLVNLQ